VAQHRSCDACPHLHATLSRRDLGAELLEREIKDDNRLSNILNFMSSLHWIQDQPHKAIEWGQKALTLSRKTNHLSLNWAWPEVLFQGSTSVRMRITVSSGPDSRCPPAYCRKTASDCLIHHLAFKTGVDRHGFHPLQQMLKTAGFMHGTSWQRRLNGADLLCRHVPEIRMFRLFPTAIHTRRLLTQN
jgi:hypothetical protein